MDNHLHGAGGGPGVDLSRARSMADVNAAVQARVQSRSPATLIVSNSDWHEAQLQGTAPAAARRSRSSRAAASRGARARRSRVHPQFGGARAVGHHRSHARAGRRTHHQVRRWALERRAGRCRQRRSSDCRRRRRERRGQQLEDRVADYKKLNAAGLTTIRHPGISIADYRMLQEMQKRGQLTMRVNALLRPGDRRRGGIDPALDRVRHQAERGRRVAAGRRHQARRRRRLRRRPDARSLREAVGRERHVPRPADHRHRTLRRRGPRTEHAGLARRDARGRRCRDRSRPERLRESQRRIDRSSTAAGRSSTPSSAGPITCRA